MAFEVHKKKAGILIFIGKLFFLYLAVLCFDYRLVDPITSKYLRMCADNLLLSPFLFRKFFSTTKQSVISSRNLLKYVKINLKCLYEKSKMETFPSHNMDLKIEESNFSIISFLLFSIICILPTAVHCDFSFPSSVW